MWARKPGTLDFDGHSGQMMLNQLVKHSDDLQQLTGLLVESLTAPASDDEAVAKIQALVDHVENIRVGAYPAPGHVPFLVTYFWGLADRERWPVIWASGREFVEFLTGESYPPDLGERYRVFLERVRELTTDHDEFEMTAGWWDDTRPVFVDEVLLDRAAFGHDSDNSPSGERLVNARAMAEVAGFWGSQLVEEVSAALGRSLKVGRPSPYWSDDHPRGDLWVDWRTKEASGLGMRVWVNQQGLAVALRPGEVRKGWWDEVRPMLESADYPGCRSLGGESSQIGEDVGLYGAHGAEFVYGRWFDRKELAELDLAEAVVEVSTQLRPLFEKLLDLAVPGSVAPPVGNQDPPPPPLGPVVEKELIEDLADELLIDRSFLDDVIALLEDKGQVIFYGPPGTGKTYLARKLAEALAPDPTRRALVQFHPSSSYEDFFEGYRPEADDGGEMTYRLTPGPLALMAAQAADAPGWRHVMIIDEVNRANLPKVLGELLFLLEYRGESVRTLYRPEHAFQLPQNLWFIGTMNTADRSIALVDAALRRRFHFVPFFPNYGPMEGLLKRWIERHHGEDAAWVWELVAQVNDELERELGGPHLQLGPSHFMKRDLDEESVRRIWKYNIEPFMEDQFFGDRQQIDDFRFDAVYHRYREWSGADEVVEMATATEGDTEVGPAGAGLLADE